MHDDKRDDDTPNPWRDDPDYDSPWRDESSDPRQDPDMDPEDDLPSFSYRDDDDDPDPRERHPIGRSDEDSLEAVDIWGEPRSTAETPREDLTSDDEQEAWESEDFSDEESLEDDDSDDGRMQPDSRDRQAGDGFDGPLHPGPASESSEERWPLALIVVAVIALLLVTAGGYGVIKQRSAMQAEITELRARLAETASPDEVVAARRALEDIQTENSEMRALVTSLREENQRLSDTLAGLEQQVDAQREVTDKARETAASAQPAEPETPKPAATAKGNWFVNFGAYREQPLANEWAGRLREGGNTVVVMPIESNGRKLYRVRITGLASESSARQLAGQLEKRFELDPLWVGRQ